MEPGQVELSSLLGWLRTFSLQSQVGFTMYRQSRLSHTLGDNQLKRGHKFG